MKYIAILRGINVGGRRPLKMADLRDMFNEMDFQDVSTYIQSGNVIFSGNETSDLVKLGQSISKNILDKFDYEIPVIVRSQEEWEEIINQNPYWDGDDIQKLHLTLLEEIPDVKNLEELLAYDASPDTCVADDKSVYIRCEGKYHESKLTNNFIEKKLKVRATTRNWKTVMKLRELFNSEA